MSWAGKILRVDLTERKTEAEPTSSYVKDYLGGAGIGAKIIYDELPPEAQAMDPENILTFNAGVMTGTLRGNRCEVQTKSPLLIPNTLISASLGGQLPSEMKFAGYDNIIIKGKADKPVYLYIHNDRVEIRDAGHLWGQDVYVTQSMIRQEIGDPNVRVACIGPAGENLVAYSMIIHDIHNTASRSGPGAVMGSKNLKAIAIRGTKGLKVADPKRFLSLYEDYFAENIRQYKYDMLAATIDHCSVRDGFTWGNENDSTICPEVPEEQRLLTFYKKHFVGKSGCAFCPEQCKTNYSVPGIGNGIATCTAYYEFRIKVKSYDLDLWWKAILECDRYGIDIISMCNIISWLMHMYEKGIISSQVTGGVPMEWGSEKAVMTAIEKVAKREGFGKIIADGIVPAAKQIGKDSIIYALQSRGVDYFTYYPWIANLLSYAVGIGASVTTSNPGVESEHGGMSAAIAEHYEEDEAVTEEMLRSLLEDYCETYAGDKDAWKLLDDNGKVRYRNKAKLNANVEDATLFTDLIGFCDWGPGGPRPPTYQGDIYEKYAAFLTADTGMKHDAQTLREVVRRVRLLQRSYEYLCGLRKEHEVICDAMFQPIKTREHGIVTFDRENFEEVKKEYYEQRGCDPATGVPLRKELERLGLKDVADRLESALGDLSKGNIETEKSPSV